ncbi:MAG TPA: filamentous hemagglutinin N-terminal domain-containing protein [Nostocaceae cyanobacterium]|nr:filamentous hemagglutinin N-terminal domain-containing protein [Nostocaceae cyanobacterium]
MNKKLVHWTTLGLTLSGVASGYVNTAIAQIVPDNTLTNNSQITTLNDTINIQGGTQPIGSTSLFHSFQEFSVPNGFTANFNHDTGIENIITRVTGNSISKIEGTLKTNGTTNLFLINPNGIVFGANAAVDINGSFIASTANSIIFSNNVQFSATDPQAAPLLQVSVPVGLQFGSNVAPIYSESPVNNRISLKVGTNKTLALVGGNITLAGMNLRAESGRVELGSVGANSLVRLNPEDGWKMNYQDVPNFQDIRLFSSSLDSNLNSIVDASGTKANSTRGGSIDIQGRIIEISGYSILKSDSFSVNNSKDITINAVKQLIIRDGGQVGTFTRNRGKGGDINITSGDSVNIIGNRDPRWINIFASANNQGLAGDITIQTKKLHIQQGGKILADASFTGNVGNIIINTNDLVEIEGITTPEETQVSSISASNFSVGNPGSININTGKLIVRNQGIISVRDLSPVVKTDNAQKLGALNVNARSVLLDNNGGLTAETTVNNGGNIALQIQDSLLMKGGSTISATAGGNGDGGNISINSPKIFLQNGSRVSAEANSGDGGNISLGIQDLLLMQGGSQITTSANGDGNGGNITINAPNGFIVATPLGNNDITANANLGSGGKITINAQRILGLVPRTRAELAELLNTENPNPQGLPTSDITAISQQNPSLNGIVQINTPDVDPSKGLTELDEETVDTSQQIDRGCGVSGRSARGSFSVVGKGGFAANPNEVLSNDGTLTNWISLEENNQNSASSVQPQTKDLQSNSVDHVPSIVEAQGWVIDANGKVSLVANTSNSPAFASASCTTP